MTPDPRALQLATSLVAGAEGCRLKAYMPTPDDRPTIGYGATFNPDGSPVHMGQVWTQGQADTALSATLAKTMAEVAALCAPATTTATQLAALTSLAFNIGVPAFAGSTVRRRHRAGDLAGAADAFLMWNRQGAAVLPGLTNRRRKEAQLYRSKP